MLTYPPYFDYPAPRIAFFGPMASGKTYAAKNLYKAYNHVSLAYPLKQIAFQYYGVSGKTNNERQILQELADDLKKWDNDTFTKQFLWDVYYSAEKYIEDEQYPIVCDDLRFTHEARDLKEHGFLLIRVDVPEDVRMARIAEKYPDTDPARFEHRSEKQWKDIVEDYRIAGQGTESLDSLREVLRVRFSDK